MWNLTEQEIKRLWTMLFITAFVLCFVYAGKMIHKHYAKEPKNLYINEKTAPENLAPDLSEPAPADYPLPASNDPAGSVSADIPANYTPMQNPSMPQDTYNPADSAMNKGIPPANPYPAGTYYPNNNPGVQQNYQPSGATPSQGYGTQQNYNPTAPMGNPPGTTAPSLSPQNTYKYSEGEYIPPEIRSQMNGQFGPPPPKVRPEDEYDYSSNDYEND